MCVLCSLFIVAGWSNLVVADGNAVIRARAGKSEIVITTTSRLAGAIHSLTWGGKEFIDSTDHGRQLQSAANFDCGKDLVAETFNPTEAGSRADGAGKRSSSKLLRMHAGGADLETTIQMACWLRPGEKSEGHPARNDRVLSDHLVSKHVHIGHKDLPHAIEYDVTFTVPKGEKHTAAVFEAVTGYMPAEFSRFWKYEAGRLKPLDDGPGEQPCPVVLATPSGSHAMGVYSPQQPSRGFEGAGYGRFRFRAEKVVKWNCVFRVRDPKGIAPGDYRYRMFVIVGSLDDVRTTLDALHKEGKRGQFNNGPLTRQVMLFPVGYGLPGRPGRSLVSWPPNGQMPTPGARSDSGPRPLFHPVRRRDNLTQSTVDWRCALLVRRGAGWSAPHR